MACFTFVIFLSLICLFPEWTYHQNQQPSLSTINELLSSKRTEVEQPITG